MSAFTSNPEVATALLEVPGDRRSGKPSLSTMAGHAVVAALLASVAVWIGFESLTDLVHLGLNDAECSHILLVPVMFVWLVWMRRGRLTKCQLKGRWTGVAILAIGSALWAQGYHYQIQSFWHLGAVMLIAGSVLVVLGSDAFWRFLPAWVALVFLVPIPGRVHLYVAAPLERVVAAMTQSLSEVLGITVDRSGNQLTVNGVDICIAEACNGMRLVFTLFLACYVFAFVKPLRWWVRLMVLALSPFVAILCNIIRLVPTVWMFGHTSHQHAETFHDTAGWVMLVIAFIGLTGLTSLLDWIGIAVYRRGASSLPVNTESRGAVAVGGYETSAVRSEWRTGVVGETKV